MMKYENVSALGNIAVIVRPKEQYGDYSYIRNEEEAVRFARYVMKSILKPEILRKLIHNYNAIYNPGENPDCIFAKDSKKLSEYIAGYCNGVVVLSSERMGFMRFLREDADYMVIVNEDWEATKKQIVGNYAACILY